MNQETINAVNQWASQIQNAIVKAAPAVWATAVHVKQADAIGAFVTNGVEAAVLALFAGFCIWQSTKHWSRARAIDSQKHDSIDCPGLWEYLATVAFGVPGIIATCFAWSTFAAVAFDQWAWIGATNPGLAVAHDIIQKILSQ
jgi:hypothetical protein